LAHHLIKKGFKLVSNGTDNHLMLVDLSDTPVTGKQFEEALGAVEISVNKNTVPNEKRSPFVTSGVRFGTPAMTSRGMKESDMVELGDLIFGVFSNIREGLPAESLIPLKQQVTNLAGRFPLYSEW
jgi:glycine hydroxymethyltransferase